MAHFFYRNIQSIIDIRSSKPYTGSVYGFILNVNLTLILIKLNSTFVIIPLSLLQILLKHP